MQPIPQETLEILSRLQSPSVKDSLSYALTNGYNSYDLNKHNTWQKETDVKGLEEFCKIIYTDWRKELISKIETLSPSQRKAVEALRDNAEFKPENIARSSQLTPFYNIFREGFLKDLSLIPPSALQNNDIFLPHEAEADGPSVPNNFLHVYGWAFPENSRDKENGRFYINLMSKNIPQFAIEFYRACREQNLPYYFKFSACDNRNDPFVVYSSYEHMPQYLQIIESIKQARPELFENAEMVSPNLAVINDNIGYGDQPEVLKANGKTYSFNELRELAITKMRTQILATRKELFKDRKTNEAFTIQANPMTFEEFSKHLFKQCLQTNLEFTGNVRQLDVQGTRMLFDSFKSKLKDLILTGEPMKDCNLLFGHDSHATVTTSKIDWLLEFEKASGKQFENNTQLRAYLTRFITFKSSMAYAPEEDKLIHAMHKILIKGLKRDLEEGTISTPDIAKTILEKLDVDYSQLDKTGRAVLVLASANFIEKGDIVTRTNKGGYCYNDLALEAYEAILGEEKIDEIISDVADEYSISPTNLCFNKSSQQALTEYVSEQQARAEVEEELEAGDVEFFERHAKKHDQFFTEQEADEDFFIRAEQRAKHRAFFEDFMSAETDTTTTATSGGPALVMSNDRTISSIINSLKQQGINVTPQEISMRISQHQGQGYTPDQIASMVELDCQLRHEMNERQEQQESKNENARQQYRAFMSGEIKPQTDSHEQSHTQSHGMHR